jgi:WD40 repeat protein
MSRLYRLVWLFVPTFLAAPSDAGEPRVDALGDPLPARALLRLGTSRWKAASYVDKLAFSPDDACLFSSGTGRTVIQKWDLKTGRLLETWPALGQMVDLSPDGRWILAGTVTSPLRVVDVSTGSVVRTFTKDPCKVAAFSPDGRTVLCAVDRAKTLILHGFVTGQERRRYEGAKKDLSKVVFSPDGKFVAACEENDDLWNGTAHILIWETVTAKLRTRIVSKNQGLTYDLAFTPDNRRLIVGSGKHIRIFDVATGQSQYVLGHNTQGHVAVDPKGRWLVAGFEGVLWDLQNDCSLGRLTPPRGQIGRMAISHDGRTIATAQISVFHETIDLWDAATGALKTRGVRHHAEVDEVAFSPDGRTLATRSVSEGTIRLWDADTGKPGRSFEWGNAPLFTYGTFGFQAKGAVLLAGGRRWEVKTGQPLHDVVDMMDAKERRNKEGDDTRNYQMLQIAPNGRFAADLDLKQRIRVWDLRGDKVLFRIEPLERTFEQHPIRYTFTPDSKTLIVSQHDSVTRGDSIRLFDVDTQKLRTSYRPETSQIHTLLCPPEGDRLIVSATDGVEIRTLGMGDRLYRLPLGGRTKPLSSSVALSSDGRLLAFESERGELTLCETATGKIIDAWPSSGPVLALAFSPDGRRLLAGNHDSSALLWSLEPARDRLDALKAMSDAQLWDALAGEPSTAYAIVWKLASSPERALALLAKHLTPEAEPDNEKLQRWLKDMGDPSLPKRDEAKRQLLQLGLLVVPPLREALKEPHPLETRRRLEELLRTIEAITPPPERLREQRALQIMEMLATAPARRLLATLAKGGAGSPRTRAAQAALARLQDRDPPKNKN